MRKVPVVFYARVASDAQRLQLSAASRIMFKNLEREGLVLIVDGVSTTSKVQLKNRIKLQQLLDLTRRGKVHTLVLHDHDRLATEFFQYLEVVRVLYDHNVQVIFTGMNVRPFDKSIVVEAISAIQWERKIRHQGKLVGLSDVFEKGCVQ